MRDRPYPWVMQNLPGVDPPLALRADEVACRRCGYVVRRRRKKCPACFTRFDQPVVVG